MMDFETEDVFIPTRDLAYLGFLYVLYAAAGIVSLIPAYALPGGLALMVALFLTWLRKRTRHPILASHYLWLRRSFWIGMGVYLSVATLAMIAVAAPAIDTTALMQGMADGTITTTDDMSNVLMAQQPRGNLAFIIVTGGIFCIWWLWRCGYGLRCLVQQRAILRPKSWL